MMNLKIFEYLDKKLWKMQDYNTVEDPSPLELIHRLAKDRLAR